MNPDTSHSSFARLRSLPAGAVRLSHGFLHHYQVTNRAVSLRQAYDKLESSGNFNNFRLAAGGGVGEYRNPVFMDSDVYKWIEAAALDLANQPDPALEALIDEVIALVAAAQMPDGYLNTHYQVLKPDQRWSNLAHDHEMYCAGHLIEAAVSHFRVTGKTSLLSVAQRFADHIDALFGRGRRNGYPGHPEIETALVELYRVTGDQKYLDLAGALIDRRGQNRMDGYRQWGAAYHQDHLPVRAAKEVVGHAVRQLYLNAGVTDLYLETGEPALMEAQMAQWWDMTARKSFITGGEGSRHAGEAFGAAYELPSTTCYCETCAAIASMMWNWRLLLTTGEARFADQLERALYNGFLSGISLDGQRYFYVNPLQSPGGIERQAWFGCACCPPNVMRQLASLGQFAATWDEHGVQLHQFMPGTIVVQRPDGSRLTFEVQTRFPWDGRVDIRVTEMQGAWQMALRLPGWARECRLSLNGQAVDLPIVSGVYAALGRALQVGDQVTLELAMAATYVQPNPRVDDLRGSLAIQRGPLVYCLEQVDQPAAENLLDVSINPAAALREQWQPDLLDGVVTVHAAGALRAPQAWQDHLYLPQGAAQATQRAIQLTAVPYFAWANRGPGAMRVWIPES